MNARMWFSAIVLFCLELPTTHAGNNNGGLTKEEAVEISDQAIKGDYISYDELQPEEQHQVIEQIKKFVPASIGNLPPCAPGYWGAYGVGEPIEQRNSTAGLNYQIGPNCYRWASDNSCGTDNNDLMLSFYFGNHAESLEDLRSKIRWSSTNPVINVIPKVLSGLIYERVRGGGRDDYNIYACIPTPWIYFADSFLMRKY